MVGMHRDNIEAIYPLTPMQQGMLSHSAYASQPGNYTLQTSYELRGDLDVESFSVAWRRVLDRHAMLRTSIHWEGLKKPHQVVHRRVALPLEVQDWRGQGADQRRLSLDSALEQDVRRGVDLTQAPLWRVTLIRMDDAAYRIVWLFHHMLMEGWSAGLVLEDLGKFYRAIRRGEAIEMGAPPRHQSLFRWLHGRDTSEAEDFWKDELDGFTVPTQLPGDRPKSAGDAAVSEFVWEERHLPESTSTALEQFTRSHQLTLNSVVHGVWAFLLSRYSGSNDVLFGSVVSGREWDFPGVQSVVGLCLNCVPARFRIKLDEPAVTWLQQLHADQIDMREHAFCGLSEIQGWSEVPRGRRLFESLLTLDVSVAESRLARLDDDLEVRDFRTYQGLMDYPLAVMVSPTKPMLVRIGYETARFERTTIQRIHDHLRTVFDAIVVNPSIRLANLPLIESAERRALLVDFNDTRTEPSDECVHELFERWAARTPKATAIEYEDQSLAYAELDSQSNRVARYLRSQGVGPDVIVALCFQRSPELYIAILAVLKAGGAYMLLDPSYPRSRLAFMIEDAQAPILLSQTTLVDDLPELESAAHTVIRLDRESQSIAGYDDSNLRPVATPQHLAYVIYTSGSTGLPKGTLLEHRGLRNVAAEQVRHFDVGPGTRVLQCCALGFDAAVFEFVMALASGATLVLARREELLPGPGFTELLRARRISLITIPPSVLAASPIAPLPELKTVTVAGEACPQQLVKDWAPGRKFFNLYGPTEATIWSTISECHAGNGSPTIGGPIANTQVYVLDDRLEPVPVGLPGELHIGGVGLARGYLNQAELRAERFIPNPFGEGRLYKTGDLVRHLPSGEIEFLGRIDHQVKLHGFRIELGEIEAVLEQHPAAVQATVLQREDTPGVPRLVGYVVCQSAENVTQGDLLSFLRERLPEHAVPAAIVMLDAFPLTAHGKIDRAALPAPSQDRPGLASPFVAPRNSTEERLATIWSEVLRVDSVGIHDKFFELGGDSILSIQIVARAREAGMGLVPRDVFEYETIAELAAHAGDVSSVKSEQGTVTGAVPLSPIQRWFFEQDNCDPHHFNQAIMFEAQQSLDAKRLAMATRHVLAQHDALRGRFYQTEKGWTQEWSATVPEPAVEQFDLSEVAALDQPAAIESAADRVQAGLDLEAGCLVRMALFHWGAGRPQRLLIVIHHLGVDAVSWPIILDDLERAYDRLRRDESLPTAAKTTSFKEWSIELRTYADAASTRPAADYWLSLRGQEATRLPADHYPVVNGVVGDSDRLAVSLDESTTQALVSRVTKAHHAQMNEILLAGLTQVLAKWTGSSSIWLDLEGHGREEVIPQADLSRTVGWFTTLFPVCLELQVESETSGAIRQIKEQLRAVPHHGLDYGVLRYLSTDEGLRKNLATVPEPEISFNYLGRFGDLNAKSDLLRATMDSCGHSQSPNATRRHLLEVIARLEGGRLRVDWIYNTKVHDAKTVQSLATALLVAVRDFAADTQDDRRALEPADFPLSKLTQTAVDDLVARYPKLVDIYPLSPMQEGMLFHTLMAPEDGVYHEQLTCRVEGAPDLAVLRRAWQEVVDRHGVLRSAFAWKGIESPVQIVLESAVLPWFEHDWRDASETEQSRRLTALLTEDLSDGFDLRIAPAVRIHVVRVAEDQYDVIWGFHHVLLDGWCLGLILAEVRSVYEAFMDDCVHALPHPRPYRDYIAWLQQQDVGQAEAFWKKELRGFTAPTPLGVDHQEVGEPSYAEERIELPSALRTSLDRIARKSSLTLNTIVQGAWSLLLARYSGERDIVYGATVSGRPPEIPGVDTMIGMFINTLPVRVQIAEEDSLSIWLRSLQRRHLDIRAFEHTPLALIQRWSAVRQGQPLFESIFIFESYPVDREEPTVAARLQMRVSQPFQKTNYPLALFATPGETLWLGACYDRRRFDDETVVCMLGHIQRLLAIMADGGETMDHATVADLLDVSLMSEEELRQLDAWSVA